MPEIVLNSDPASTYGASAEYRAAWFAAYGSTPVNPDPPDYLKSVYIDATGAIVSGPNAPLPYIKGTVGATAPENPSLNHVWVDTGSTA